MLERQFDNVDDEKRRIDRIDKNLQNVISGDIKMSSLRIENKKQKKFESIFSIEPEVLIDDTLSQNFTVIEISCFDKPGLLYDLTCILSDLGLDITSAHIATFGERAVDTFYVNNLSSPKIKNAHFKEKIQETFLEALS